MRARAQLFMCTSWWVVEGMGMFVCTRERMLVNLYLNVQIRVYLHARLPEEHCSFTQCTALTFLLHLSACTKAFLPGFDKCESVAGQKR